MFPLCLTKALPLAREEESDKKYDEVLLLAPTYLMFIKTEFIVRTAIKIKIICFRCLFY